MRCLRGSICIKNLENVDNSTVGKTAMLDNKPYLDKLELQWKTRSAETVCDDLFRKISAYKITADKEHHEAMIKCTIHYDTKEDAVQTASLYVLKDMVKDIQIESITCPVDNETLPNSMWTKTIDLYGYPSNVVECNLSLNGTYLREALGMETEQSHDAE